MSCLKEKIAPNKFTYPFVFKACNGIGYLNLGKSVHGLRFRFGDEVNVQNTLARVCIVVVEGKEGLSFHERCSMKCASWIPFRGVR